MLMRAAAIWADRKPESDEPAAQFTSSFLLCVQSAIPAQAVVLDTSSIGSIPTVRTICRCHHRHTHRWASLTSFMAILIPPR